MEPGKTWELDPGYGATSPAALGRRWSSNTKDLPGGGNALALITLDTCPLPVAP